MSEIEWGPEIEVDGERPNWLESDQKVLMLDGHANHWYGDVIDFFAHDIGSAETKIRLPSGHPYYNEIRAERAPGNIPAPSGSNAPYYDLTINGLTVSCNDVIDALGLNFNRGELFKAVWRAGRKPGTDEKYDLDKMVYFANRERERHG